MKQNFNGLLVLDKSPGMTSREAVNEALKWFPRRTRIGHTGSLDPLATGVLVLCLGEATRLAEFVQDMGKTYRARIVLGARSDTDDADGAIVPTPGVSPVGLEAIRTALGAWIGTVDQTPPRYSAVKIGGKRAHDIARKGQPLAIAPRPVVIDRIDIVDFEWPRLDLEIDCGKGTYIRSLARDLGDELKVGAFIAQLRRCRVGPFVAEQAVTLNSSMDEARRAVRPTSDAVAHFPSLILSDAAADPFCHGQAIVDPLGPIAGGESLCTIFSSRGQLIGLGLRRSDGMVQPSKVVCPV